MVVFIFETEHNIFSPLMFIRVHDGRNNKQAITEVFQNHPTKKLAINIRHRRAIFHEHLSLFNSDLCWLAIVLDH